MGAERWVGFISKEINDSAQKYLDGLTRIYNDRLAEYETQVWLDWKNDDDFGPRLVVEYSFGSVWNETLAMIMIREIARRFEIERIGSDSTGWYNDNEWNGREEKSPYTRYGPFQSWVIWVKNYDPEWSPWLRYYDYRNELARFLPDIEATVSELFKGLDENAKSNL